MSDAGANDPGAGGLPAVAATRRTLQQYEDKVRLPGVPVGSLFHVPRLHHSKVLSVAFDSTGRWLAWGDMTGLIRLVDAWTGATHALATAHAGWIRAVSIGRDADGRLLVASGGDDEHVRLHRLEGGALVPVAAHHAHAGYVIAVSLGRDAEGRLLLASGGDDGYVHRFVLEQDDSLTHLGSFAAPVGRDSGLAFLGAYEEFFGPTDQRQGAAYKFLGLSYTWGVQILDAETGAEYSRLHLLKNGFVWTEPPNHGDISTFWTNRTDLIEVLKIGPDGEARALPDGDPERDTYLARNNTPVRVRDMVFDPEGFARRGLPAEVKAKALMLELETQLRAQIGYEPDETRDDGSA